MCYHSHAVGDTCLIRIWLTESDSCFCKKIILNRDINSLWNSDAIWRRRSGSILAHVMALPEPMLSDYLWGYMALIWEQFHQKWSIYKFPKWVLILHLSNYYHISQGVGWEWACMSTLIFRVKFNLKAKIYPIIPIDFGISWHWPSILFLILKPVFSSKLIQLYSGVKINYWI